MTQHRFILLDDNQIDLMVSTRLLQSWFVNAEVTSFNNTIDALEFFSKNKNNLSVLPTVVLLDLIMPRLDGFQVVDELERILINIPFKIFLLSSTINDADFDKAKENRWVQTILSKPLEVDVLSGLI
ncbi:MAG: response regulator [Bacteroidetes bacterium]|nr:response regulator [Bacteroidota bacterium]